MFPTITDLTKTTAMNAGNDAIAKFNAGLPNVNEGGPRDGVRIVRTAANDGNNRAFQATISRIMAQYNANDVNKKPLNDNYVQESRDGIVSPSSVDHSGQYERTMDRIMSLHNAHDREFQSNANDGGDNPIAMASMERIRDRHLQYHGDDDLPEFANDWNRKKKRIIEGYNPVAKAAKRSKATGSGRRTRDELEYGGDDFIDILHSIESNTLRTADGIDILIDSFDEQGVDYLRARERDLEAGNGYMAGTRENGSSMAPEGKKNGEKGLLDNLKDLGVNIVKPAIAGVIGGGAQWIADMFGASEDDNAGGGNSASKQGWENTAESRGNRGVAPTRVPRALDHKISGNYTGREVAFMEMLSQHEGADYDTEFGYGKYGSAEDMFGKKLSELTISEVIQLQQTIRKRTKAAGIGKANGKVVGTSAVGKYQFVEGTMTAMLKELGYQDQDFSKIKFTPELQDRLALANANANGLDPNNVHNWGAKERRILGQQWESLDVGKGKISSAERDAELSRIAGQDTVRRERTATVQAPNSNNVLSLGLLGNVRRTSEVESKQQTGIFQRIETILHDIRDGNLFSIKKTNGTGSGAQMRERSTPRPPSAQPTIFNNNVNNNTNNVWQPGRGPIANTRTPPRSKGWWESFTDYFD